MGLKRFLRLWTLISRLKTGENRIVGKGANEIRAGWDVEADGMFGVAEVAVIVGEEAHPVLFKALGLEGYGRNRVVRARVDKQGRMRADAFPTLSGPTIAC